MRDMSYWKTIVDTIEKYKQVTDAVINLNV